ncbi:MAG: deoxyuridine 5'-triphosphate nucleotidohydrolase [Oscillospiraceae bacterium]|nr:deoxyuridine 5'-triphosphate nucleotidohydrolase [Oscillospiraceae bacterium]
MNNEKTDILEIRIKYHCAELEKICSISIGDWIDLRAAEHVELKAGDYRRISLGVSMKLPEGYEAHIAPRSSSFQKWGFLQVNSVGVVDNSYSGTDDLWMLPVYATRDATIELNDRICQFRILRRMPEIRFLEVDHLDDENRGGFGSTGGR